MMVKKISLFAAAAIITCSVSFAQSKKEIDLKKGQKFLVENKTSTISTTEVQGQPMEVTIEASTTYQVEVTDLKENSYDLTNTVKKVKMELSQMGQQMNFDSEKKEDLDGPMGSTFKSYLDVPQKVTMNNQGDVVPDTAKAADKTTTPVGDFESTGFGATMTFQALPKNLKLGQSWEENKTSDGAITKTAYTVKAINGDLATLTLTGDMDINKEIEQMGMSMTTKLKGKFTGEAVVNTKTGVMQSQSMVINSDGILEVMGQELPMSSKVTSTTSVKTI